MQFDIQRGYQLNAAIPRADSALDCYRQAQAYIAEGDMNRAYTMLARGKHLAGDSQFSGAEVRDHVGEVLREPRRSTREG